MRATAARTTSKSLRARASIWWSRWDARAGVALLTKTIGRVSTEMSVHVLAYNLKRVMRVLGITETMKAMRLVGA